MNPHATFWSKRSRRFLLAGVIASALVGTCAFCRIRRPQDLQAYLGMASECHPVWKQFAFRRFGEGDSALELIRRFPPTHRQEFGQYGIYRYSASPESLDFTSLTVVARDGKLLGAAAGSCTWRFEFFGTKDPELNRQYEASIRQTHPEAFVEQTNRFDPRDPRRYGMQKGGQ
jgi:hypothetical protein